MKRNGCGRRKQEEDGVSAVKEGKRKEGRESNPY